MKENRTFSSKVLLFGEYSIIKDSMALSTPYPLFEGRLTFQRQNEGRSDQELKALSHYLKKLAQNEELLVDFDTASFEFDISQGLFFDSTIPQGFGVGSSGAVCASVFDNYGPRQKEKDIMELKKIFSQMESHFHGSSSGIDPLIAYLNCPILVRGVDDLLSVDIPRFDEGDGAIFLLNTGRARRTEPLVNLFLEKCKSKSFDRLCETVLTPITNNCISSFLEGDFPSLFEFFRDLSDFQFRHFNPMIPKLYQDLWIQGLQYENFYLKLCGAGGGGFIIGLTANFQQARHDLKDHELRPLFRF